jgi:hypothetical protein
VRTALSGLTLEQKQALILRAQTLRTKAGGRLQAFADAAKQGMVRTSADNEFGGKTYTMTFSFTAPNGGTHKSSMVRIYNADKVLVSAVMSMDRTGKNGMTMRTDRTKTLQAGGSYLVRSQTTMTLPNGRTRTMSSEKTITATGTVTGTGTMTRTDGPNGGNGSAKVNTAKALRITLGGTEEKAETTVTDTDTQVSATVAPDIDTDGDSAATVRAPGSSDTKVKVDTDLDAAADAS